MSDDGYEEIMYKSSIGIMVNPVNKSIYIGDLSKYGITDFKDLPDGIYPVNKCKGCGARSYTRTEENFECDYCGNKYLEI